MNLDLAEQQGEQLLVNRLPIASQEPSLSVLKLLHNVLLLASRFPHTKTSYLELFEGTICPGDPQP